MGMRGCHCEGDEKCVGGATFNAAVSVCACVCVCDCVGEEGSVWVGHP